ncbi:Conserved_hypothetical protein [Hexamita inflata]|uniref:Transmembrane protein n=1 Tax=Hexamita inflata TaxID=28002 RepID=A0AA86PTD7_9EUKA|nr:Conserved hypothetical protein [Hexamita inflata]CAI9953316.1 Conserved hypothetical protein [Hexamita inflata]
MIFVQIFMISVSSSFSECFSAKSHISGNDVTYQLNLHLIPFEKVSQITDENLCKMYLPGKIVVAFIHYDDISFPVPGGDEVNFIYKFNQEIIVTFKLSPANYAHVQDKQNAMYELWYDVNLVKVNNSVNTIEHTKYNGTGCFQNIQLEYTMYGDIDVLVAANSCNVPISANLQVYVEFQDGLTNSQLPIYPCTVNCDSTEFQLASPSFNQIHIYRITKTALNADLLQSFYNNFVNNRRIKVSLNLKFNTNGIFTIISKEVDSYTAHDILNCKPDPVLNLFAVLNPDSVQIQFRDAFPNKLNCQMPGVVSVRADLFLFDSIVSERLQKNYIITDFNENIGVTFGTTANTDKLRKSAGKTIMVVSYLNINEEILYELIIYNDPFYVACVKRAQVHLYESQFCVVYQLDSSQQCIGNIIQENEKNTLGMYVQEKGKTKQLGLYKLHTVVDYSKEKQTVCFTCDEFVNNTVYAKQTCAENQAYTKEVLKREQIQFAVISKYEFITFKSVIAEYKNNIYLPIIATASILTVVIAVVIGVHFKTHQQ